MMMFVLGMLAWQVVTAVVYFVSEDDEKGAICGSAICSLTLMGIGAILRAILLRKFRKYNLYQFFGPEGDNGQPIWIGNYYMTEEVAERFNLIDRNDYPENYSVRLHRAGYEFKSIPPKNEILTAEMIDNGISGMSKDFFEKFFKKA